NIGILEYQRDSFTELECKLVVLQSARRDRFPENRDGPGTWKTEPIQQSQQSRFSRPIRSDQCNSLPTLNAERNVPQCNNAFVVEAGALNVEDVAHLPTHKPRLAAAIVTRIAATSIVLMWGSSSKRISPRKPRACIA